MGRSDIEDPKLAEVKAILARLQRMSPDDEPEPVTSAPVIEMRPPALRVLPQSPETAPPAMPEIVQTSRSRIGVAVLTGGAAAALLLFATRPYWMPAPQGKDQLAATTPAAVAVAPPPAPKVTPAFEAPKMAAETPSLKSPTVATTAEPQTEKAVLQQADRLIRGGSIIAGRSELLRLASAQSADIAWALARAFDPTVVGRIENADAPPDIDEAAKWYRQWHTLAVRQGLVADSVSIDRMIRAMRQ